MRCFIENILFKNSKNRDFILKIAASVTFFIKKELESAHGETRTPKVITPTASETATFANFATWAARGDKSIKFIFHTLKTELISEFF